MIEEEDCTRHQLKNCCLVKTDQPRRNGLHVLLIFLQKFYLGRIKAHSWKVGGVNLVFQMALASEIWQILCFYSVLKNIPIRNTQMCSLTEGKLAELFISKVRVLLEITLGSECEMSRRSIRNIHHTFLQLRILIN